MISTLVAIAGFLAGAGDVDLRTSINGMAETRTGATANVTVFNPGPGAARAVVVTVELPEGARDVEHAAECAPTSARSYDCVAGELARGRYDAGFSWTRSGGAPQTITATARSEGDPNPANDTATFNFSSPSPVFGSAVRVGRVSGVVRVRRRGRRAFKPLESTAVIPVDSEVDTSRGRVRLISAVDREGATQSAEFYRGRFRVSQSKQRGGLTQLRLTGPVAACGTSARASARRLRRVWGDARGRFRTRGLHGAASVRGTRWLTEDRCDGTYVRVVEGEVAVRDFARGRTVRVTAGHSYLARARR